MAPHEKALHLVNSLATAMALADDPRMRRQLVALHMQAMQRYVRLTTGEEPADLLIPASRPTPLSPMDFAMVIPDTDRGGWAIIVAGTLRGHAYHRLDAERLMDDIARAIAGQATAWLDLETLSDVMIARSLLATA